MISGLSFIIIPSPGEFYVNVDIGDRQSSLLISSSTVEKLAKAVIRHEGQECDEVGIHFVNTEEICQLHEDYFQDPSPTDCISFPLDNTVALSGDYRLLGDVFVCPETAIKYAAENEGNPYQEVTLYLVHGLLHLMGYDDIEDSDRVMMRAAEDRHMRHLKSLNLWLHP
jgi:probable rRNA maturation factor